MKPERMKWRPHDNMVVTRPIRADEIPGLIEMMREDDLSCFILSSGVEWYSGRYRVKARVVREAWGFTDHQFRRIMAYIYENNPWEAD